MAKHEAKSKPNQPKSTPLHDNHLRKPERRDPALAWRRRSKLGVLWCRRRPLGETWRRRSHRRKMI
jgi:hypothetical protein